jgi:AraC-like DNA-binding protein
VLSRISTCAPAHASAPHPVRRGRDRHGLAGIRRALIEQLTAEVERSKICAMWIEPALHRRLCRARDLLVAVDKPLSVEEVATIVGVSQFHFIRVFEAMFGATPHQFRTDVRLDRARDLLARDHSVTDVCFELGFASPGSFSRLFARHTGVAPSAYRRWIQVPRRGPLVPGCFGLLARLPRDAFRNFGQARV